MMNSDRVPDWIAPSVTSLTPEWLSAHGIHGLVLDLDNTLAPYGTPEPSDIIAEWLNTLRDADIRMCVASNNNEKRVSLFCKKQGLPYVSKARKPDPAGTLKAVGLLGLPPDKVAFAGDQIFSDVRAANRSGLLSIYVQPLTLNIFFRIRLLFEQKYIRRSVNHVTS